MNERELETLDLLAKIDDVTSRLRVWSEQDLNWRPTGRAHALVRRVLDRVDAMRLRLDAPLIVATFGGTGTGKSSLVNALLGTELTPTGRERPTTKRPVLILHHETDSERLGFDVSGYDIRRFDNPELRDIVLLDCPDPDTSETRSAGTNLAVLRSVLPHCDVLIFTATQQKYRSARVVSELADAAPGCRLVFVQTHADRDEDIREDWREQLAGFEVPEMFFVDSLAALEARRQGRRPEGDFARLYEVLRHELAAGARTSVRRANVFDLLGQTLGHCLDILEEARPAVTVLEEQLAGERSRMTSEFSKTLKTELLSSRALWERRILSAVTERWGIGSFSSVLRLYNGLGGVLSSLTMYRARSAAHVALIGAAEGARRVRHWSEERAAAERSARMESVSLDEAELRSSRLVIAGYAEEAGIAVAPEDRNLEELHAAAGAMERDFLAGAGQKIDAIIEKIAAANSRWHVRVVYEFLFGAYLLFVLWRIAKNFFWDSFARSFWTDTEPAVALLPMEFYLSAGVFLLLWSGVLVIAYTRRLRRGLDRRIGELTDTLGSRQLASGLFPQYEEECRRVDEHLAALRGLRVEVESARADLGTSGSLGHVRSEDAAVAVH